MSVLMKAREVKDVLVLNISGRLTVSDHNLRDTVLQFLKAGKRQFVLKMSDVSYVDSCGLGELVTVYTSIRNAGGTVRLLTPSERVRVLLNITKLDTVFDILEDVAPFVTKAPSAASSPS